MKHKLFVSIVSLGCIALTSCGQRGDLVRSAGEHGPAIPAGEPAAPTADEQNKPSTQARPQRSDEVLRRSEERQDDEYDLPPS